MLQSNNPTDEHIITNQGMTKEEDDEQKGDYGVPTMSYPPSTAKINCNLEEAPGFICLTLVKVRVSTLGWSTCGGFFPGWQPEFEAQTMFPDFESSSCGVNGCKEWGWFKREQIMKTRTREQTWSLDQFKWHFCNSETTGPPPAPTGPPPAPTTCTHRTTTCTHHRTTVGPPSVHHLHPSAHWTTDAPPPNHRRTTTDQRDRFAQHKLDFLKNIELDFDTGKQRSITSLGRGCRRWQKEGKIGVLVVRWRRTMALFFRKIEVKKVKMRMRSSVALMKPRRKMVLFLSEGDGLGVKAVDF
ncbi:hypothetical protein LXL04_026344 [Taraxacum kok-saghyz]